MPNTTGITSAARLALGAALGMVLVAGGASPVGAQAMPAAPRAEFLITSGTLVPTGAQRDEIGRGKVTAAQFAFVARPNLALTATVGWARSHDIAAAGDPKLNVFTYDLGAELRTAQPLPIAAMTFQPLVGAGAGARSYDHRGVADDATHNLAAYGSVGGELGYRRVRVRLEARDYVTGFKPLAGAGASDRRNDVVIMVGLRLKSR